MATLLFNEELSFPFLLPPLHETNLEGLLGSRRFTFFGGWGGEGRREKGGMRMRQRQQPMGPS